MPPRSLAPSPTPPTKPPLIRFSNATGSSSRQSSQLEHKLSQSLPAHASAGKKVERPRFMSMSGRTRTRKEEVELDAQVQQGELQDEAEEGEGDLEVDEDEEEEEDQEEEEEKGKKKKKGAKEKNLNKRNSGSVGRRKIAMSYIEEKNRRTVTFTKRKSGLMKKAFELSTLTGTDCLVVVVSESGLVYTFATPSLKGVTESSRGREVIGLALKGELPIDDDDGEEGIGRGGEGDGRKRSGGKTKGKGKEKDKEKSTTPSNGGGSGFELDLDLGRGGDKERERNELLLGMGIDPSLGGGEQHYPLPSTSSTATDPYAAFTLPDHDSNQYGLPNPPILNSYPQNLLPIPPPTSLPPSSSSSSSQGYDPLNPQQSLYPFYYPQTSNPPSSSSYPNLLPQQAFPHTSYPLPPASTLTGQAEEGPPREGMVDFERASKEHELAFQNYERRMNASLLLGQTPAAEPIDEPDSIDGEGTRTSRSPITTTEVQGQKRPRSQGVEETEEDLNDGFGTTRRKSLKLGMKDFGPVLLDWNNKVKKGSFHPQGPQPQSPLSFPSPQAQAQAQEQVQVQANEGGGEKDKVSIEDRRKFWKEKSEIMIRLSSSSPTLLNFLQASLLSQFSLQPLPPSTCLSGGYEEIGLPLKGTKEWVMMEFARFVGGTRGLGDTNLSHQGGVLEGTIEGFLIELESKEQEGGKGFNMVKQHLVGWFDWLEGHSLIDEDTHDRLCAFESGEGQGRWEEVKGRLERERGD